MKPAHPDHRRERIARVNAKRPVITVRATYRPRPQSLEQLADLVLELLDERGRLGGG